MKEFKNQLDIMAITAQIYWVKTQIFFVKQLIKLQNEIEAFQYPHFNNKQLNVNT
jgi:hypothetical protein